MGLREAISLLLICGAVAVARADTKPARPAPGKAAAGTSEHAKGEARPAAERPDPATADPAAEQPQDSAEADEVEPSQALPPHIVGPRQVDLGNNTAIDLPEGFLLLERAEAQELLRKNGDPPDGTVAMVFKPGSEWRLFIDYDDSGYIDDSDAGDLDADDLIDSYRKGTAAQNKTRKALGKPELVIDRWTEPPRYERAQHHLVWGLAAHAVDGKSVNFFTRILGRKGFLSVDLIDAPERIEASKKEALAILQATHFQPGSTYTDHVSGDRSSGLGLRGLVLGGAGVAVASKLGLLAKILLVFKKAFILVFAAIGGFFRWLFRRKPRAADPEPFARRAAPDLTGSLSSAGPALQVDSPPLAVPLSDGSPPPDGTGQG